MTMLQDLVRIFQNIVRYFIFSQTFPRKPAISYKIGLYATRNVIITIHLSKIQFTSKNFSVIVIRHFICMCDSGKNFQPSQPHFETFVKLEYEPVMCKR